MSVKNLSFYKYFKDIESEFLAQIKYIEKLNPLEKSFNKGDPNSRKIADKMVSRLIGKNSTIIGIENILNLYDKTKNLKSSLILMEHYSNFDYPGFQFLLNKMNCREIADHIIPLAGIKLFKEDIFVKTFSLGFDAILIYPPHSFVGIGPGKVQERRFFNANSMKDIYERKNNGYMILLFPTATRYRPRRPETKKVISEIGNYFRIFDYFIMIGINGNLLEISRSEDMKEDVFKEDTLIFNSSKVFDISEYLEKIDSKIKISGDKVTKEILNLKIVQDLEERFEKLHKEGSEIYQSLK